MRSSWAASPRCCKGEARADPLQRPARPARQTVGLVALAVARLIFLSATLNGEGFRQMFLTAVSVAVAAVPEGLPAVVHDHAGDRARSGC
jgi:Ca2+-transporting ATPase